MDVWSSPPDTGSSGTLPGEPTLVLPEVLVVGADREAVGVGGEIPVVLEVATSEVPTLVRALRSGVIDLTAVPITDDPA